MRAHRRCYVRQVVRLRQYAAQLMLDQAKALYRYWPYVEVGERLLA